MTATPETLLPTEIDFTLLNDTGGATALAFARITFNDVMTVHTKIVRNKQGNLFLALPQEYDKKTNKYYNRVQFKDAHLDNTAGREYSDRLQKWAIEKYHKAIQQEQARQSTTPQTSQDDTPPSDW